MWFRQVLGWLIKFGLYDGGYLGLANLIVRNILFVHPVWEVSVRNSMKQFQIVRKDLGGCGIECVK